MDPTGRASDLAEIMRLAYERGYTTGAGGNASLRVEEGFLITPSGKFKGRLGERDILLIDSEGRVLSGRGRPSSEWRLHLRIYETRPDLNAILHCHHPLITGMTASLVGDSLDRATLLPLDEEDWTEEARVLLRDVRVVPWRPYGTEDLAMAVSEAMMEANAVIVLRHGPFVASTNPWMALASMDSLVEVFTIALARRLGRSLPSHPRPTHTNV